MKRSKVTTFPAEIRKYLDRTLIDSNFSGYVALEAELAKRGFTIGKSSLHRYGSALERRIQAIKASTDAAVAIQEAAPDDEDLRSGASISMLQTGIFNTILQVEEAAAQADPVQRLKLLSAAAKNLAALTNASGKQKRWMVEMRGKTKAAADAVALIARKGGMSKAAEEEIRRKILGIATT